MPHVCPFMYVEPQVDHNYHNTCNKENVTLFRVYVRNNSRRCCLLRQRIVQGSGWRSQKWRGSFCIKIYQNPIRLSGQHSHSLFVFSTLVFYFSKRFLGKKHHRHHHQTDTRFFRRQSRSSTGPSGARAPLQKTPWISAPALCLSVHLMTKPLAVICTSKREDFYGV